MKKISEITRANAVQYHTHGHRVTATDLCFTVDGASYGARIPGLLSYDQILLEEAVFLERLQRRAAENQKGLQDA